mgnify:CR=1 FL=1
MIKTEKRLPCLPTNFLQLISGRLRRQSKVNSLEWIHAFWIFQVEQDDKDQSSQLEREDSGQEGLARRIRTPTQCGRERNAIRLVFKISLR